MTRDDLITFEKEVARRWEAGEIHAPVHLSGGNEDSLIEIFQNIKRTDWICATWRSHYAALLHGIQPDELMRQILAEKSMSINSVEHRFYSSAIAGGILPIAVGLGMAIKRKKEQAASNSKWQRDNCRHSSIETYGGRTYCVFCEMEFESEDNLTVKNKENCPSDFNMRHVWCFVGDMASHMGIFSEATKYAFMFDLPVTFIIEDNLKSVQTPTREVWNLDSDSSPPIEIGRLFYDRNTIYYRYELTWPHHGSGVYVAF